MVLSRLSRSVAASVKHDPETYDALERALSDRIRYLDAATYTRRTTLAYRLRAERQFLDGVWNALMLFGSRYRDADVSTSSKTEARTM
jgi:hypothetical protein